MSESSDWRITYNSSTKKVDDYRRAGRIDFDEATVDFFKIRFKNRMTNAGSTDDADQIATQLSNQISTDKSNGKAQHGTEVSNVSTNGEVVTLDLKVKK